MSIALSKGEFDELAPSLIPRGRDLLGDIGNLWEVVWHMALMPLRLADVPIQCTMPNVAVFSMQSQEPDGPNTDLQTVDALIGAGFQVRICTRVAELFTILGLKGDQLVVLDVAGAGEVDIFMLAAIVRATFHVGILLFVGPSHQDRARGLDHGADVCLSTPVQPLEMVAVLRALHRRITSEVVSAPGPTSQRPTVAPGERAWILENRGWRLRAPNGAGVDLTALERDLLVQLFQDSEQILRRDQDGGGQRVVDKNGVKRIRNIDVTISRLRLKVSAISMDFPIYSKRGVGYQFSEKCVVADTISR